MGEGFKRLTEAHAFHATLTAEQQRAADTEACDTCETASRCPYWTKGLPKTMGCPAWVTVLEAMMKEQDARDSALERAQRGHVSGTQEW